MAAPRHCAVSVGSGHPRGSSNCRELSLFCTVPIEFNRFGAAIVSKPGNGKSLIKALGKFAGLIALLLVVQNIVA